MTQTTNSKQSNLFILPPGVDFAQMLVDGLKARFADQMGQVELYVNTSRMQRRVVDIFNQGPASLIPRLRLLSDPAHDPLLQSGPPPVSNLQRKLELSALIDALLDAEPDLAPEASLLPLTDSLAELFAEMHGEGVSDEVLSSLDVSDQSEHWARSLQFFKIAADYEARLGSGPSMELANRRAVEALCAKWEANPPQHPVILAGSTASRGTTALLAHAIAKLPQGAIVFPGADNHMPAEVWAELQNPLTSEDHPQYRLAKLAYGLEFDPSDLPFWHVPQGHNPARNNLISLALRPAPVTDAWLAEGPKLTDISAATQGLTLLEAPSPRIEAEAIALRLRQAAVDGTQAALISPDRNLTRQVAAALVRWGITADDSAGEPLHHTPPGRLLCQIAEIMADGIRAENLLILLKHPLVSGNAERGDHLRFTRDLELHIRRNGPPVPSHDSMLKFAGQSRYEDDDKALPWAEWVSQFLPEPMVGKQSLPALLEVLVQVAEGVAGAELWDNEAGHLCHKIIVDLQRHSGAACALSIRDFGQLLKGQLQGETRRTVHPSHPNITILGTLEARVQAFDLVIVAGLNEGVWPSVPSADPWLNRAMRAQANLLLPDRRIGLAAHDFQQAVGAPDVWISRSIRSEESETVASRWLNRLTNLLSGLEIGRTCLSEMRERAAPWLAMAHGLDRPLLDVPSASRPSPRPPVEARPRNLRITDVGTLLRDPYAIYARLVLQLNAIDPLVMQADARNRGIVVHNLMERFVNEIDPNDPQAVPQFLALAGEILERECPWPAVRAIWMAQIERHSHAIVEAERQRRADGDERYCERKGATDFGPIRLHGRADRIDMRADGSVALYDYKTGAPPSEKQQAALDKQLLIEAAMVTKGGFEGVPAAEVALAEYLQIGSKLGQVSAPLADHPPEKVYEEMCELAHNWMNAEQGYTARMAAKSIRFDSPYDQLARFGEWDDSDQPEAEDMP